MERTSRSLIGAIAVAAAGGVMVASLHAQGRGWTTSNGDAQRTSWVRSDVRLTKDAVQKGEMKFLWKMKLANESRQLHSLTQPILLDRLILASRLQGAGVRRRERRAHLRDRYRLVFIDGMLYTSTSNECGPCRTASTRLI